MKNATITDESLSTPRNIEEEIKLIRQDKNSRRFTLVLGSGFHKAAIGNGLCLSNWDLLLLKLGSKSCSSKNYILQFEELILEQATSGDTPAHKLEEKLLTDVETILASEAKQIEISAYDNLKFLFDSDLVSDVISLNYDSVAEKICKKQINGTGKVIWQNANTDLKEDSRSLQKRTTDYRKIANNAGSSFRFWYPHGSLIRKDSIVLSVNKYSQLLVSVDKIRKHYKRKEREYFKIHGKKNHPDWDSIDLSWYSQLLNNPVIFLGTSLSEVEWDLWTAITHANRNFAKEKNKNYKHNMYIMLDKDQKCHPNSTWLKPLFAGMTYEEQWGKLKFHFEKTIIK